MNNGRRSRFGVFPLGWLLAAGAAFAGQSETPADFVVRDVVEVREISLDAVVTDREGAPVAGLSASDFKLRVNGEKVKITGVSTGEELRQTLAGRLTVVVLLDELHLQPTHRARVLATLEPALVDEMQQNPTWVAVVALEETLQPLLAPTRDIDAVREALRRQPALRTDADRLREQQRMTANEVQELLRSMASMGSQFRVGAASQGSVLSRVLTFGEQLAADSRATAAQVGGFVDAMAFVPGRKAVLMVSDGLHRQPLDAVAKTLFDRLTGASRQFSGDDITSSSAGVSFNDPNRRPSGSDRADQQDQTVEQRGDGGAMEFQRAIAAMDNTPLLGQVTALANTHGVTFYPVKPPVTDTSVSGLGERQGERGSIKQLSDSRTGLQFLADATGGLMFDSETGVEDFLRQTKADLAAYYALAFQPPKSMPTTGVREMVLRVRGRQNKLRYRASYMPLELEQGLSSQAWGTLLFGWQDNPHGLLVESRTGALEGELHGVDLLLSLPIGKLELLPAGELASGNYRVVMQLVGEDGTRLEPKHLAFAVNVPAADLEAAADQFFAVRSALQVRPGSYRMAVGLWEENTGSSTFVLTDIEAGATAEDEA